MRVSSQHPSSPLLARRTWQGHAVKIGGLARAAVESDLGAADTTQGRLRVLQGQFQDPAPVLCRHITTLLLFSESLSLTRRPRTSGSMLRVYCWSARSVTRTNLPLRSWQLGFVMASAALWWIGRSRARYAPHSSPLSLVSLSVPAPVAPPIVLWLLPRHKSAVMPTGSEERATELVEAPVQSWRGGVEGVGGGVRRLEHRCKRRYPGH